MKKYHLLIFFAALIISSTSVAQNVKTVVRKYKIDESTVVKDSSGTTYAYPVWSRLVASGDARLTPEDHTSESPAFILRMTTPKEKEAMLARMPRPVPSEQFKTGDLFKPFKEKDIAGEKIDLKQWAGKIIVLNFWFIGCPPCRAEISELNSLAVSYKDNKDVIFVSVALDEDYEIKEFLKDKALGYHIIDRGRYIAEKYNVHLYPTNVVINRNGLVAFSSQGGSASNTYWMKKAIDEGLSASPNTTTAAQ